MSIHADSATKILPTFRISSKSSLNPSATDVNQNFLNRALISCSFFSLSSELAAGRNEGISVGGGDGDGENLRVDFFNGSEAVGLVLRCEGLASSSSSDDDEEEDEEDESECEESGSDGVGAFLAASFGGVVSSSESDEDEDEEESEDAALRFLFLTLFLGAGFAATAGGMAKVRSRTQYLEPRIPAR